MTKKNRYEFLINYFLEHTPDAETELFYDNPFQLLVAVILSAQCTDKRVNLTTPAIFEKYPDAPSLSKATFDELFPLIRSISYPNNKTKHLIGMANMLVDRFQSEVPMTVDELVLLPGVGRKTANVITSVIDEQPNMAVDTHVFRVSKRIGLVPNTATTPLAVEKELIKNIPGQYVHKAHHLIYKTQDHCMSLHYMSLHFTAFRYTSLHLATDHCISLQITAYRYILVHSLHSDEFSGEIYEKFSWLRLLEIAHKIKTTKIPMYVVFFHYEKLS